MSCSAAWPGRLVMPRTAMPQQSATRRARSSIHINGTPRDNRARAAESAERRRRCRSLVDDARNERFTLANLGERNEFVRTMRVGDRAGTANDRLEAGVLELPGLRRERDLAAASAEREPLDAGDDVRRLFGVQSRIVGLRLEVDAALRRD